MATFYEILGVSPQASTAEIRQAYVRLAREKHPDRFSDPKQKDEAQSLFQALTSAFNTLSNDKERRAYDESLAHPRPSSPAEVALDAYERGVKAFEARDIESAMTLLRIATHNAPDDARYHAALGRVLAQSPKSAREAAEALEHAVRLAPQKAAYHADLAALFLQQGLKIRAKKPAETALKLAPGDAAIRKIAEEAGVLGEEPPPEAGGLRSLLRRKP